MSCANCGAQTPPEATQCPVCGLPLSWPAPATGEPPSAEVWGTPQGGAPQGASSWGSPPTGGPAGGPTPWGASPGQPYQPYPSGWDQPQPGPAAGRLAGWWQRVGATILDAIIIFIPARIIEAGGGRAPYYVFFFLATLVYTTVLLTNRGQTVGMMVVGTKCVREGTGANLAYGPAVGRWAMTELLNITIVGGVLDALWPLWDANNQTLHDKVVHSLVIKVR